MPSEFIEQTEKAREKQRRLALREEKMEKQRVEQEKRAERSLERAHVSNLMCQHGIKFSLIFEEIHFATLE